MEKVSQVYELLRLTPNYECSTMTVTAFNLDSGQQETQVMSFLDLAINISPDGLGKVLIPIPYDTSDNDTGPSEDVRFMEVEISDFIQKHFGKDSEETTLIEDAVIDILEIRNLRKTNCVTC